MLPPGRLLPHPPGHSGRCCASVRPRCGRGRCPPAAWVKRNRREAGGHGEARGQLAEGQAAPAPSRQPSPARRRGVRCSWQQPPPWQCLSHRSQPPGVSSAVSTNTLCEQEVGGQAGVARCTRPLHLLSGRRTLQPPPPPRAWHAASSACRAGAHVRVVVSHRFDQGVVLRLPGVHHHAPRGADAGVRHAGVARHLVGGVYHHHAPSARQFGVQEGASTVAGAWHACQLAGPQRARQDHTAHRTQQLRWTHRNVSDRRWATSRSRVVFPVPGAPCGSKARRPTVSQPCDGRARGSC